MSTTHLAAGVIRDDVSRMHYFSLRLMGDVLKVHGIKPDDVQAELLHRAFAAEDAEAVIELSPAEIIEGDDAQA